MLNAKSLKVSILIPVFNGEKYIRDCLDSVISQTYENLQIVVLDDGSTDKSFAIASEYSSNDSRVEIYHQENKGVSAARNVLLKKVKGDYVLFVDSDDWMEPDMVEVMVKKTDGGNLKMVTCESINDNEIKSASVSEMLWDRASVVKRFIIHKDFSGSLWNKLIRCDAISGIEFPQNISYGEDALFVWNVIRNLDSVKILGNVLYHHRLHNGSLSSMKWSPQNIGSGVAVWKQIYEDTLSQWPEYSDYARSSYAISFMWQLFYASMSRYPYDEYIKYYQTNLKSGLDVVKRMGSLDKSKMFFARVAAHSYFLAKLLALAYGIYRRKGI